MRGLGLLLLLAGCVPGSETPRVVAVTGWGMLDVDLSNRDVDGLCTYVRDFTGMFEDVAIEGPLRVRAGEYRIEWTHELAPCDRELTVTVPANGTAHVTAAMLDEPHVPAGLGLVAVDVRGYQGEPLPGVDAEIYAGVESVYLTSDRRGRVSIGLMPGAYRLELGARVEEFEIRSGHETYLDVRAGNEGEVRIPTSKGLQMLRGARYAESEDAFVFVQPGVYDFCVQYSKEGWRPVAKVVVEPRATTWLRYDPPGAYLVVEHGGDWRAKYCTVEITMPDGLVVTPKYEKLWGVRSPPRQVRRLKHVPPGRYHVLVKDKDDVLIDRYVDVGDRTVVVKR